MWRLRVVTDSGTFHPEGYQTFQYGIEEYKISLIHPTEPEKVLFTGYMQPPSKDNWNEWLDQARVFRDKLNGVKS